LSLPLLSGASRRNSARVLRLGRLPWKKPPAERSRPTPFLDPKEGRCSGFLLLFLFPPLHREGSGFRLPSSGRVKEGRGVPPFLNRGGFPGTPSLPLLERVLLLRSRFEGESPLLALPPLAHEAFFSSSRRDGAFLHFLFFR